MNVIQLPWSDRNNFHRAHVIDPESTTVKAVATASATFIEAHREHVANTRELEAARSAVERFAERTRIEAAEAGVIGKKADKKAIKKRRVDVTERFEDAEIDYETSSANLQRVRVEYLGILAHHAPALIAEARRDADSAILSLTSASTMARRGEAALGGSTAILAALPRVVAGEDFIPTPPKARRKAGDDTFDGGSPGVFAGLALENLGLAVGWGQRVLEDLAVDEKVAKMQAETDAAPDLDDDDDDDDDE